MSTTQITGHLVCFASSFRCDGSRGGVETPNISHAVLDGSDKTLCGRRGWETDEGPLNQPEYATSWEPDCLRCARALKALRAGL
jgi:hypothetical protein